MKYLLTGVAAIALLTGCGGKKEKADADHAARKAPSALEQIMDVKLRSGDPATAAAALSAFSLGDSGAGRVAFADSNLKGDTATFTNVTITPTDDNGEDDTPILAKKLTFDGLGMIDGQANFSRMTLTGISIEPHDLDENETVDATIGKVELINPSPETAAWVASLLGKGKPAEMPVGEALSFDKWAMNDLSFNMSEEGKEDNRFVIESIKLTGIKNERAEQMLLKNMHLDIDSTAKNETVKFDLDQVEVRKADMSLLRAIAEGDKGDGEAIAKSMIEIMNNNPIDPGYDYFNVSGLDMAVEGVNFAVPKMTNRVIRNKAGQPIRVYAEPYKMTLNANAEGGEFGEQLASGLATMGYDKLTLTGESDADYDPDTDTLTYKTGQNYIKLDDGFKLNFGGKVEGYSSYSKATSQMALNGPDAVNPEAMMEDALKDLIIHNFEIKLVDNSIVDRAFNAYAAKSGEDPQQLRNQSVGMLAMAPLMLGGSGMDMELITDTTGALSKFLTSGGTFTLKLAPKQPIKISELVEMEDPSAITKETLGFSATHSK